MEINNLWLFVSFDLVGSTKYKETNKNWIEGFEKYFKSIWTPLERYRTIKTRLYNFKSLGDELVYCRPLEKGYGENLLKLITTMYKESLYIMWNNVEDSSKGKLSVKATAWICPIDDLHNYEKKESNILGIDCIGKHMDQGFRIVGSFARARRLTLSLELACILSKYNTGEKVYFYPLGYKQLKGVWNGNYYPVIWSSTDNNLNIVKPQSYFSEYEDDIELWAYEKQNMPETDQLFGENSFYNDCIEANGLRDLINSIIAYLDDPNNDVKNL